VNRPLEEAPQVRLAPCSTHPCRRDEAKVEGGHRREGQHLSHDAQARGSEESRQQQEHHRRDEEPRADRNGRHSASRDPAGAPALARECVCREAAHGDEKADDDDLNELLHALEPKGREHAHADEGGSAGDLDPARRATEIIDQAEHGVWSRGEQDERDRGDAGLSIDAEPAGHTGEHHCPGDGAEQQGSVETHRGVITQCTAKHDHEQADEQELIDEAYELESGQRCDSGT